jgi:hypothetical protein
MYQCQIRVKEADASVGSIEARKQALLLYERLPIGALRGGLNSIENEQNDNDEERQPYPTARAITPISTMRPARNYA